MRYRMRPTITAAVNEPTTDQLIFIGSQRRQNRFEPLSWLIIWPRPAASPKSRSLVDSVAIFLSKRSDGACFHSTIFTTNQSAFAPIFINIVHCVLYLISSRTDYIINLPNC